MKKPICKKALSLALSVLLICCLLSACSSSVPKTAEGLLNSYSWTQKPGYRFYSADVEYHTGTVELKDLDPNKLYVTAINVSLVWDEQNKTCRLVEEKSRSVGSFDFYSDANRVLYLLEVTDGKDGAKPVAYRLVPDNK